MPPAEYLRLMAVGFALTVAVETAVLWVGLSRRHPRRVRLFCGVWLTACTYPVVWLVLPPLFADRWAYLVVAEAFAAGAEAALFGAAFGWSRRDALVVVGANAASFAVGEALAVAGAWP